MDPLNTASAFATIVGLICNFKNEKKSRSEDEYKTFLEWLQSKRHNEVIQHIEMNSELVASIRDFLEEDNEIIIQKLETIDDVVAKIASGIEGLAGIAKAEKPDHALSQQCFSILRQLNDSDQGRFMEIVLHSHSVFQFVDGNGSINYGEPRFIEDDLRTLVDFGLLRLEYNSAGKRIFYVTRAAVNLVQVTK